jgi:hypothetical protein
VDAFKLSEARHVREPRGPTVAIVAKDRATVAYVFYQLGWKSLEAKRVLMGDVHTQDQTLRLHILTGQTKGFAAAADPETRRKAVGEWRQWLVEYRSNL